MDYKNILPNWIYLCRISLLSIFCISLSHGQSKKQIKYIQAKYDSTELQNVKEEFDFENVKRQKQLVKFAKDKGLKLSETLENGTQIELIDIDTNGAPIYYSTYSDHASKVSRANTLYSGGILDLGISGEGMHVGVWDAGKALISHQEYTSRVSVNDNADIISAHATMVVGSMISSGLNENAKGVAYKASAISNDWSSDKVEVIEAAKNGMLLSNHSYGIRPDYIPDWYFGAYIKVSQDWDKIMYNAPYYLMVTAAGNSKNLKFNDAPVYGTNTDGFDLLLGFSTSKNGINVAAVESEIDAKGIIQKASVANYSSYGPTDDGRIKPDIAGCGANILSTNSTGNSSYDTYSGTSMAAPGITSSMLLLQEYYQRLHSTFMRAATLKGLVLHSADDVSEPGPDYKMGWGVMNTKKAAELIVNNEYSSIISEVELKEGEIYSITVNARDGEDLIASISWTDPAGNYVNTGELNNETAALVNDLDIRITKNDAVFYPWSLDPKNATAAAKKRDNKVDPFEKIQIENTEGSYTITVTHKGTLTNSFQAFTLIVSGGSESNCTVVAPKDFQMYSADNKAVSINWENIPDSFYEIQYKAENEAEWNTLFADENQIQLDDLTIGTTYALQVRTNCTENIFSDYSEIKTFVFDGSQTIQSFDLELEKMSIENKLKFSVHPNPTTEQINIEGELGDNAYYSIVSIKGTILKKGKADFKTINVEDLSSGFYSLTIFEDGEQQSMKFIKNYRGQ